MTVLAIFLINAGLSFALSLVAARLLGPEGFGRYAVAVAIAVVLNTVLFEWLRLSTTRFYSATSRLAAPAIRAALARGYGLLALGLIAATALAWSLGLDFGLTGGLLAATAFAGLSLGLYDYQAALARARFLDGAYATLALTRGIAAFVFATGAAWLWGDPVWVLVGASAAAFLGVALVWRRLADPSSPDVRPTGTARGQFAVFARYALPLVTASAVYQVIPVVNRLVLADRAGFAEAGFFSLASEIGMRLFQNLGSALDLVLFQMAVRTDALHGRAAAERQIARNTGIVAAVLWPAAIGFWLILPSFEIVFVPEAFRGRFAPAMDLLIPGLAAFALIQYALNPVFQLRAQTAPVVAAAFVALGLDLALVVALPDLRSPIGFAGAQLAAMVGAALVLGVAAIAGGARLPWRDLAGGGVAAGAMAAALWPLAGLAPSTLTLAIQVGLGALVYGMAALAFDLVGCRAILIGRWRDRGAARHPAPEWP